MAIVARLLEFTLALAIIALCASPRAETATESARNDGFVREAVIAIDFQAQSATHASKVSTNKTVKAFAEAMMADYQAAATKLKRMVSEESMPQPPQELDPRRAPLLAKLKSVPAAEFDALYVEMQVAIYRDLLVLFTQYADFGTHASLKAFAEEFLLLLKGHQGELEKISKALPRPA